MSRKPSQEVFKPGLTPQAGIACPLAFLRFLVGHGVRSVDSSACLPLAFEEALPQELGLVVKHFSWQTHIRQLCQVEGWLGTSFAIPR